MSHQYNQTTLQMSGGINQSKPRYQPDDKIGGRYLTTNSRLRKAFENEASAIWVAPEKHPNIVRCFNMDTPDNHYHP